MSSNSQQSVALYHNALTFVDVNSTNMLAIHSQYIPCEYNYCQSIYKMPNVYNARNI